MIDLVGAFVVSNVPPVAANIAVCKNSHKRSDQCVCLRRIRQKVLPENFATILCVTVTYEILHLYDEPKGTL